MVYVTCNIPKFNYRLMSTTCFSQCINTMQACNNLNCKKWCNFPEQLNCTVVAASNGPHTYCKIASVINTNRLSVKKQENEIVKKLQRLVEAS